jgi:hypothetical protein
VGTEELSERLTGIAEEIGDLALDALRQASHSAGPDEAPDPALLAEERRLTRARRAVEKAAHILRGPGDAEDD